MSTTNADIRTRLDELWSVQQEQERAWQETLANDPEYLRWLNQMERQRAEPDAARAQAEIKCSHQVVLTINRNPT